MYLSDELSLTTTAVKVVDAEEFERSVALIGDANATARVGYTSTDGIRLRCSCGGSGTDLDFVLPAGQELWAWTTSGSAPLHILVSR